MSILADRFFEAAEAFFRKTAVTNGLGIGMNGRHVTAAHGPARALTLFGWRGETSVAVIFGIPEAWQLTGRGYLLWLAQPGAEAIDLDRLPTPVGEQIVSTPEDLERFTMRGLRWLEGHPFAEVKASFYKECLAGDGAPRGSS